VASAPEPRRRPSGHRQGFVAIVGGRACPWRRLDCPPGVGASAPAPRWQCHVATSGASAPARAVCSVTWGSASADRSITALKPLPRTPVPRPTGQGSRPPGRSRRRSSEHRPPRSTGARRTALFGAPRARPHRDREPGALRSIGPPTPPGQGTGPPRRLGPPPQPGHGRRRSSEHRAHGLTGTGNHISSEARPPIPPETGNHISSEARPPISNPARAHGSCRQGTPALGARQTALFGAPPARPRRSPATGALRDTARQAPPGQGTGPPRRIGPPSHRARTLSRDGHPAHWGRADGALRSTGRHASPGPRPRAPRSPGDRPHRSREPGPPRRTGAPASARTGTSSLAPATGTPRGIARQDPGLESRTSSEARTPHLTGHRPPRPSGQGHRRLAGRDQRTVRHPPRRTGGRQRPSTSVGDPRRAGR